MRTWALFQKKIENGENGEKKSIIFSTLIPLNIAYKVDYIRACLRDNPRKLNNINIYLLYRIILIDS